MNELIKITEKEGVKTVNARELHEYLESGAKFADWIKGRIEKYDFIENVDYVHVSEKKETSTGATISKEYYITIDMAKELSMVENNDKGKEARRYFIEQEKKNKKDLSPLEILKQQVIYMENQERRQKELETRIAIVEAKQITSQQEYFTIAGYAALTGRIIDVTHASILGRQASNLSKEYDYEIGKIPDPRFGSCNTYHLDILKTVFTAK